MPKIDREKRRARNVKARVVVKLENLIDAATELDGDFFFDNDQMGFSQSLLDLAEEAIRDTEEPATVSPPVTKKRGKTSRAISQSRIDKELGISTKKKRDYIKRSTRPHKGSPNRSPATRGNATWISPPISAFVQAGALIPLPQEYYERLAYLTLEDLEYIQENYSLLEHRSDRGDGKFVIVNTEKGYQLYSILDHTFARTFTTAVSDFHKRRGNSEPHYSGYSSIQVIRWKWNNNKPVRSVTIKKIQHEVFSSSSNIEMLSAKGKNANTANTVSSTHPKPLETSDFSGFQFKVENVISSPLMPTTRQEITLHDQAIIDGEMAIPEGFQDTGDYLSMFGDDAFDEIPLEPGFMDVTYMNTYPSTYYDDDQVKQINEMGDLERTEFFYSDQNIGQTDENVHDHLEGIFENGILEEPDFMTSPIAIVA